ncbi:MAG: protein kinase [Candidatus Omnitrophica bacterium]|nr:protein kinase [Candidatus Omnitrophota bacterium]
MDENSDPQKEPQDRKDPGDRYSILESISEGGMGIVYRARDNRLDRVIALKRLRPAFASNPAALEVMLREAKSIASLQHPGIVQVFDVDTDDDGCYIAMEYVRGGTLKQKITQQGGLDPEEVLSHAHDICRALDYAHRRGIVHLDIKPSNILMDPSGMPKLVDFGLARFAFAGKDAGGFGGTSSGTLDYMSPEQRRGDEQVDFRSDIYSFGATLYEALTGESPRIIRPEQIQGKLRGVILKCLEENADHRYQDVATLMEEIRRLSAVPGQSISAPGPMVSVNYVPQSAGQPVENSPAQDPAKEAAQCLEAAVRFYRQGRLHDAQRQVRLSLKLHPGETEAKALLARLEEEIKEATTAARRSGQSEFEPSKEAEPDQNVFTAPPLPKELVPEANQEFPPGPLPATPPKGPIKKGRRRGLPPEYGGKKKSGLGKKLILIFAALAVLWVFRAPILANVPGLEGSGRRPSGILREEPALPKVDAVVWKNGQPMALIDGRQVQQGEVINGYLVTRIEGKIVVLQRGETLHQVESPVSLKE